MDWYTLNDRVVQRGNFSYIYLTSQKCIEDHYFRVCSQVLNIVRDRSRFI